jgi:hypothetical protein
MNTPRPHLPLLSIAARGPARAAWRLALGLATLSFGLGGCNQVRKPYIPATGATLDPAASPSPGSGEQYVISSLALASGGSFTIFFDSSKTPSNFLTHCDNVVKQCVCNFNWSEVNNNGATSAVVKRTASTPVTAQAWAASCPPPSVFNTEIGDGTPVKISLAAAPGSDDTFGTSVYSYTKGSNDVTGSFEADGVAFDNILHYSCYEQYQQGVIKSYLAKADNSGDGTSIMYPMASRFCVKKAHDSEGHAAMGDDEGCPAVTLKPSARGYYYNLFMPESEKASINQGNSRYTCPFVKDSAKPTAAAAPWPLDKTFALAVIPSAKFTLPIEAYKKASKPGDALVSSCANRAAESGGDTGDGTTSSTSLVNGCLGYAAKPNPDGTCPLLTNGSNGYTRRTYRLRRYMAIYPPVFDADGYLRSEPQNRDFIYIVDRPVRGPSPTDPLSYSMTGPKPCPFAYFDAVGMTSGTGAKQYTATNSISWKAAVTDTSGTVVATVDRNVDNLQFPGTDSANACSAVLPLVNAAKTLVSLVTVGNYNPRGGDATHRSLKNVYVRPSAPWYPHYEEDTDFQACAPLADTDSTDKTLGYKEAPMHIAKNPVTNNVAWCSEAYPTQNDNIPALEGATTGAVSGNVRPYTSHVITGNVPSGVNCTYLPVATRTQVSYPAGGLADHASSTYLGASATRTCDRSYASQGNNKGTPPLLAPPGDVENALREDSSFQCLVTYDNNTGKAGTRSPTQGCCGSTVSVWTGASVPTTYNGTVAHVEAGTCGIPTF